MKRKIQLKNETKVLFMLAIFSLAIGVWENCRLLWLQDQGFSIPFISKIVSTGVFISSIIVLIISLKSSMNYLVNLTKWTLVTKIIILFGLFFLNKRGNPSFIFTLFSIDIICSTLITISIYPLLTLINKNDKLYSKKNLIEYFFKDVGVLICGIILGKYIVGLKTTYNFCLYISIVLCIISYFAIITIEQPQKQKEEKGITKKLFRYIMDRCILKEYFIYGLLSHVSLSSIMTLKMLIFTDMLDYSVNEATFYFLGIGLLADVIGIAALYYFTPKNDYLTIMLKFGFRLLGYLLVVIANTPISIVIAFTISILVSTMYENKIDAPYINLVPTKYQFIFSNFKNVVGLFGESVGVMVAGILMPLGGGRWLFLFSAITLIFQMISALDLVRRYHELKA